MPPRFRTPRLTVRVKLTALYSGLFLAAGTGLLVIVYLLVSNPLLPLGLGSDVRVPISESPSAQPLPPPPDEALADQVMFIKREVTNTVLRNLLVASVLALGLLTLLSIALGWWIAGRILRPLHQITDAARRLSWQNLDSRIALRGPDDELKELADTFDGMLARLHNAFDSQRRFIANASHELRTPLAVERAAIQIGLDNPGPEQLKRTRAQLLSTNQRLEHLLDGLLLLAQGDQGLNHREPVDLAAVVTEAINQLREPATQARVTLQPNLKPCRADGDPVLLTQLATNLIENAIKYNHPNGWVSISTTPRGDLVVRNTGQPVPADQVTELFEPFRRLGTARTASATGAGLGLSIVRAITTAHGGSVTATPNYDGGLEIRVHLPLSHPATPMPSSVSTRTPDRPNPHHHLL